MEFPLRVVDQSSLLSRLDLYQIERIVWLRLATVEQRIRGVKLIISVDDECSDRLYRVEVLTKLDSGHTVVTHARKKTIGDVVLNSAARMARQVSRRISYENSMLYRLANSMRLQNRIWPLNRSAPAGAEA